ncbi:MAG: hypothetical protein FWC50_00375 [Planctomycetaceae bacterium]|nr:hypothetical protein [Planctomycetaceae bacterium]
MKFKKFFGTGLIVSFFTAVAMVMGTQAADMRTVAVVSIADANSVVKSLKAVTAKAGFPDAMAPLEANMAQLQNAVDWAKPVGIVVLADDEKFGGYAFLPAADITKLPNVSQILAGAEKAKDGSYKIPLPNNMPLFIKQAGKWAYISVAAELPNNLPADPVKLLEGLDQKYILGVKVNVANLPKELCQGSLAMFRMLAESQAKDEAAAESIGTSFDQIEKLLNELKVAQFGVAISPANDVIIETSMEAVSGSVLAADIKALAGIKTNMIGFFQPDNNLLGVVGAGNIDEANKKQFETQLKMFFDGAREGVEGGEYGPTEIETAKFALDNLEATLESTLKSGKIDFGLTLKADATLLVGATIADGNKAHDALVKAGTSMPEELKGLIKIDDSTYNGFNITSIAVPFKQLPDADNVPEGLKDKTLTAKIGVRDNAIVVAAGITETVESDLKNAIDASKSATAVPATNLVFRPYYLGGLIKTLGKQNDGNIADVLKIFESIPKDAKITSTNTYSGSSQNSKFVIEGDLLPAIGKFVQKAIQVRQGLAQ